MEQLEHEPGDDRRDEPETVAPDVLVQPEDRTGDAIGPYKLLQKIGEGGFGTVYVAEQREPVKRKVALKIIKLGMDTKQVIARFEAERQALAMMDHPNIAKVLDAGSTDRGRPYFVMEFVRGISVVRYCDQENLGTDERLAIFIEICHAVQHAHQKGIIHRDLKPSNVLVTVHDGRPMPKVIDFGIAKATNAELTERTLFTEMRQFIGTPEYMSPEQANLTSLDIDTRSDIYSMGVLLYELLTGMTPFDGERLRSAGLSEIQRIIREEDPHKPSTRVSELMDAPASSAERIAKQRRTDPVTLARKLRGDLDWIVMKALEKDRTRRYASASEFADDIMRYRRNEPVSAGPPSAIYRLRKFARRHRAGVAATVAVAIALMLGIVGTTIGLFLALEQRDRARIAETDAENQATVARGERDRADAARADAEHVTGFLTDMLTAADPGERGRDITVREILDQAGETVGVRFQDRPAIEATLRYTIGRTYLGLGMYGAAERHLSLAYQMRRVALGDEDSGTLAALNAYSAVMLYEGRFTEAEPLVRRAIELAQTIHGPGHERTLGLQNNLASMLSGLGRYDEASRVLRDTLAAADTHLDPDHPYVLKTLGTLANLTRALGRNEEARVLLQDLLARQRRALGDTEPDTLTTMNNLGITLSALGRHGEAERMHRDTLEARRDVLGIEHPETQHSTMNLVTHLRREGRLDEAESLMTDSLALVTAKVGERHSLTAMTLSHLSSIAEERGQLEEAIDYCKRSIASYMGSGADTQNERIGEHANLIRLYQQAELSSESQAEARRFIDNARGFLREEQPDATMLNVAAWEILHFEAAVRDVSLAVELAQRANELTGHAQPYFLDTLARAHFAAGDIGPALLHARKAYELLEPADPNRGVVEALVHEIEAAQSDQS